MWLEGKEYISSKRASQLSGYAQDYIGQLARKGLIDAQRVGGLWFVSMTSLTEYKSNADSYVPPQPERKMATEVESLVSFDGKDHISASRAADITGYHPDYVGQLARSGAVISRQVGNRWYIDREGILAHKQEKDSLLGAVQSQSVGISRSDTPVVEAHGRRYSGPGPFLTYTREDGDLLPILSKPETVSTTKEDTREPHEQAEAAQEHVVPIRKIRVPIAQAHVSYGKSGYHASDKVRVPRKTISYGTFRGLAAAALTIVIVLSFGFVTLNDNSVYSTNFRQGGVTIGKKMLTAGAAESMRWVGNLLQNLLVKELNYERGQ